MTNNRIRRMALAGIGLAAMAVMTSPMAVAQDAYTAAPIVIYNDDGEAVVVTGGMSISPAWLKKNKISNTSAAALLRNVPGMQLQGAGGVSQMPVLRGLADDRLKQSINGAEVTSACANHMNPPLSYAAASQVESVQVNLPVSSVEKGGDSIGGSVEVVTLKPKFGAAPVAAEGKTSSEKKSAAGTAATDNQYAGELSAAYRSNGKGLSVGGKTEIHNDNLSLSYAGNWSRSDNLEDGHGNTIKSTEYESQNHEAALGIKSDMGETVFRGHYQHIPYQGYPNQYMDMVNNDAWGVSVEQKLDYDWGKLEAQAYFNDVRHSMNFLADKLPANMPMETDGQDFGYSLKGETQVAEGTTLRIGNELHRQLLDEWWPPVTGMAGMCCNDYWLINDGERTRLGTYAEIEKQLSETVTAIVGIRNDIVWMDTGNVQGYNTNMPPAMGSGYVADANAFNAADHSKRDVNFDATAMLKYDPQAGQHFEFGYARKTRSPNFYERYAWSGSPAFNPSKMAMRMIGWFGDANGYAGNLAIDPEVAHHFSATARIGDPDGKSWELSVSPYYAYVNDYIGVAQIPGSPATGATYLRFVNQDAEFFGFDAAGHVMVVEDSAYGSFDLGAKLAYVRGKNKDTGGDLYHMMPFNAELELEHKLGGWTNTFGVRMVTSKTRVDAVRREPKTDSFVTASFQTSYEWENLRFDAGVENIFDTYFEEPLDGVDALAMRKSGFSGAQVPVAAPGRTFFAGLTIKF